MKRGEGCGDGSVLTNQPTSHFFVEMSTLLGLTSSLIVMVIFIMVGGFTALRAPPRLALKEDYIKMSPDGRGNYDVDLTLSQLVDGHRFVSINGSLVTIGPMSAGHLPGLLWVNWTARKDFRVVSSEQNDVRPIALEFGRDRSIRSSDFFVMRCDLYGVDSVQVRISILMDCPEVEGFTFSWSFADPNAVDYPHGPRMLLCFLVGYMLCVFVFYLRFDGERFTEVLLLVMGVSGIMAANPLCFFLKGSLYFRITDEVVVAVFVAVVRLFLLVQFQLLRKRAVTVSGWGMAALLVVFGVYAAFEAGAGYERHTRILYAEGETAVVLPNELDVMLGHVLYVCVALALCYSAWANGVPARRGRLLWFTICLALSLASTLILNVFCVVNNIGMYSYARDILFMSVHVTIASISLFLLHTSEAGEVCTICANDASVPVKVKESRAPSRARPKVVTRRKSRIARVV